MYERFYQFKKAPFRITPDPAFLYLSPGQKEAVASFVFGIEQRKGFIVVIGEVGVGKTTILRRYLSRLDASRRSTAYVFNSNVGFKDLLDTICRELDISDAPGDVAGMVNRLHQFAIDEYRKRRSVVVVIDEAQAMPVETLEGLRVLSNLDSSTDKLIQIVLLGQPELAEKLDRQDLRQLKQRVAVRCTLPPYTDEESRAYIEHRLRTAGSSTSAVFTPDALRAILEYGQGIPRKINVVCDSSLVTGLGYQAQPVTAAIVREVIADLEGRPRATRRRRMVWGPIAALLVMGALLSGLVLAFRGYLHTDAGADASSRDRSAVTARVSTEPPAVSAATVSNPAASQPRAGLPVVATRVVRQGDTLTRLALDVYGFPIDEVFQRVIQHNPRISNVNWITAGTTIRFPDVSDLRGADSRTASHGGQQKP